MADNPKLFSFWRSSCTWRVRIALNFKEIAYDCLPVDIHKTDGEQYSDEYREINPMSQVPALRIDGHTLIDSLAIMQYLEETRPTRPLLPQDAFKRAQVRELCQIICSGIQPLQNTAVVKYLNEAQREEWPRHWIVRGFGALEKILASTAGKYCVGDEITMADCCLVPQVFNARLFHVDLTPYPTIVRMDRELESNPAVQVSHPYKQPDCPPELVKK